MLTKNQFSPRSLSNAFNNRKHKTKLPTYLFRFSMDNRNNLAVVTMVRKSYRALKKWLNYYRTVCDSNSLYVLSHGSDEKIRSLVKGANVIDMPYWVDTNFNVSRFDLLSKFCNGLLNYYQTVLCVDVDEFILVDPEISSCLRGYVSKLPDDVVVAPLGGHLIFERSSIDGIRKNWQFNAEYVTNRLPRICLETPMIRQMPRFFSDERYAKPVVIRGQVGLTPGGHAAHAENVIVDPNLLLVHAKYAFLEEQIELSSEFKKIIDNELHSGDNLRQVPISTARLRGVQGELNKLFRMIRSDDEGSLEGLKSGARMIKLRGAGQVRYEQGNSCFVLPERIWDLV